MIQGIDMIATLEDFISRRNSLRSIILSYLNDNTIYIGDRKGVYYKALEARLISIEEDKEICEYYSKHFYDVR